MLPVHGKNPPCFCLKICGESIKNCTGYLYLNKKFSFSFFNDADLKNFSYFCGHYFRFSTRKTQTNIQ